MWYYMYPSTEETKTLPFYLISIGLHDLQPPLERPQGYENDQFFFNSCGSGWLEMNGEKYELPEGSAFFVPKNIPHRYYPEDENDVWDVRWVEVGGSGLQALLETFGLEKGGVFQIQDESELDRILNRMRLHLISHPKYGNILASGEVYSFIMEFVHQAILYRQDEMESIPHEREVMMLKEYISVHFMHPITLDDLCEVVPVSHQHICRIFKEGLGMRPMEYVNKVRVDMAKRFLLYTQDSIKDIGEKCGFTNANYFCKTFKKQENVTPLEYRNSVV